MKDCYKVDQNETWLFLLSCSNREVVRGYGTKKGISSAQSLEMGRYAAHCAGYFVTYASFVRLFVCFQFVLSRLVRISSY